MLYMFITTTIWIEILIRSIHKFFYNIIVTIFALRINSNSNTYFKFSCHNYSFPLRFFKCNTIVQNAINSTNNCPASILLAF